MKPIARDKLRRLQSHQQNAAAGRAIRKAEAAVIKATAIKASAPNVKAYIPADTAPMTRGEIRRARLAEAAAALPSPPQTLTPRWPAWLEQAGVHRGDVAHPVARERRRFLGWLERPIELDHQTSGLGMSDAEVNVVMHAMNVRDFAELVAGYGPGTDEHHIASERLREALAPFTARAALAREMARPLPPKGYFASDPDWMPASVEGW